MPRAVSVCIPVHNGLRFLRPCLDSVLAQSFRDFEIVLVDNACTDGSSAVLEAFAREDHGVPVTLLSNGKVLSMGANWNRAVEAARGRYVKVLPCDDEITPDCLAVQVDALDRHPEAVMAGCARMLMDFRGRTLFVHAGIRREGIHRSEEIRPKMLGCWNPVGEPGACLFRTEALKETGGFDGAFGYFVDLDLYYRILGRGHLWFSRRPLSRFRVHRTSATAGIYRRIFDEYRRFRIKHGLAPARGFGRLKVLATTWLRNQVYNHYARADTGGQP